jgi:hypothetical protein
MRKNALVVENQRWSGKCPKVRLSSSKSLQVPCRSARTIILPNMADGLLGSTSYISQVCPREPIMRATVVSTLPTNVVSEGE